MIFISFFSLYLKLKKRIQSVETGVQTNLSNPLYAAFAIYELSRRRDYKIAVLIRWQTRKQSIWDVSVYHKPRKYSKLQKYHASKRENRL